MDRVRSTGKRVGSRRFVNGDGQVSCPRGEEPVDVGRCYLCDDAWEIRPVTGSRLGWVRCSYEPAGRRDGPTGPSSR